MDKRLRSFARLSDSEKVAEICRESGISRKTGYKMFNRYKDLGIRGPEERARKPYRHGNKLTFQVDDAIFRHVRLRNYFLEGQLLSLPCLARWLPPVVIMAHLQTSRLAPPGASELV
jgi:hypothetical protein